MSEMQEDTPSPRRTRRRVRREFKTDAVALVLDGDRSIASVARDLDIGETNLGNWVRQARIDRGAKPGLTTTERAELVELRREVRMLRMERGLLTRATAAGARSRDRDPLSVGRCQEGRRVPDNGGVLGRAGDPSRVLRLASPSAAEVVEVELVREVRGIHADSDSTYGSPRVTAELRRRGRCVNHKRVERLMRC